MNDRLTDAADRLEGQPMFRLLDRVNQLEAQGRNIIHFEIGDPNFSTPSKITDACVASLRSGDTHYSSSYGLLELRKAIAQYTRKDLGFEPDLGQILVSPGANALIYFIIQCLVKEDEEVIVPDPAFSTYYSVLNFFNRKAVRIPLREENAFRMNPGDIAKAVTPKTKLIVINSPQNPTGSVMTKEEIAEVYRIAQKHNIFILTDEIYRLMSFDGLPASPTIYDQCRTHTILLTGFSKSFAMTGWRLGYMIGPEFLVEKVSLLLQTIVSCVPTFIQKAGVAVVNQEHPEVKTMMAELKKRRDVIVEGLNSLPGVGCLKPQGAFYVFPNIKKTGLSSEEFSNLMIEQGNVALLPGPNFGQFCEGYVRLCYATSINNIKEGIKRMQRVLEKKVIHV